MGDIAFIPTPLQCKYARNVKPFWARLSLNKLCYSGFHQKRYFPEGNNTILVFTSEMKFIITLKVFLLS